MRKRYSTLVLSALLLAGCNSDNDNAVAPPSPEPEPIPTPQTGTGAFDNVWGPDAKFQLEGPIFVYLGKGNITRQDNADQYQFRKPENAIIIDAADVRKAYPKPVRDDIYNDGQITMAEVLLYTADIRPEFEVRKEWREELGTYKYWMSYDANQDGDFDDDGDYKDDPNWYMNFIPNEGEFRRDTLYDERGEAVYGRLGLLHVPPRSGYYIYPHSVAMTDRREYFQKQEAERAQAAKEKYPGENVAIFDTIQLAIELADHERGIMPEIITFNDVVARPHNLRPDIYKKDAVITVADALMSLHDEGKLDIGFTWWGKLSTQVDIQHFFLNEINGIRAHGADGFLIDPMNMEAHTDFSARTSVMEKLYVVDELTYHPTYCDLNVNGIKDSEDPDYDANAISHNGMPYGPADHCDRDDIDITDWWQHWNQHIFSDVWVQNYPSDTIQVVRVSMYLEFPEAESHRVGASNGDDQDYDRKWPIHDISQARAPLTKAHFGWGIADCSNCHSLKTIHSGGDIGNLGVNPKPVYIYDNVMEYALEPGQEKAMAPYQCAQCHGSNGAPDGHGEIARCFWCHSEENVPPQHGSVSGYTTKGELGVIGGNGDHARRTATLFGGYNQELYNPAQDILWEDMSKLDEVDAKMKEFDERVIIKEIIQDPEVAKDLHMVGFYGSYPDSLKTRTNNDWTTDPTYPDPYSCMTCHPNH